MSSFVGTTSSGGLPQRLRGKLRWRAAGKRQRPRRYRHLRLGIERLEDRRLLSDWSGDLPDGTVWTSAEVQRITDDVRVPAGATLSIQEGAIIKFDGGRSLTVDGTLDARGTAAAWIIFTSARDDSVGGDTNGDGASTADKGDWGRIAFTATSTGSVLDFVEAAYGGQGEASPMVGVCGAELTLTNSLLRNSSWNGLRIEQANPTVTGNSFRDNRGNAISIDLAANPTFLGNTLTNNGGGELSPVNGVAVDGGTLPGNALWDDPDIVYSLAGAVTVPLGTTLTVAPGQIVKLEWGAGATLQVGGTLDARGTAAAPIIFTSRRDDAAGGDTDNDGGQVAGTAGQWGKIEFQATSTGNTLDHVEVRYGGWPWDNQGAVFVNGAPLTLTNSVIRDNSSTGVRIADSNPTISQVSFQRNQGAALSMDPASSPVLSGLSFLANGTNGLLVDEGVVPRDAVWNAPGVVYVLGGDVTIPEGRTLTIVPGQIVKGSQRWVAYY